MTTGETPSADEDHVIRSWKKLLCGEIILSASVNAVFSTLGPPEKCLNRAQQGCFTRSTICYNKQRIVGFTYINQDLHT